MLREEVRSELRVYMSRTGLSAAEIAERAGYARQTLHQFISGARFGRREGTGDDTAARLRNFMSDNPPPGLELPGRLYETEATAQMDRLIAYAACGRWGMCYGPARAQKTFLLEYRAAEAAAELEARLVYIRTSPSGMRPAALLRRMAAGLAAPYAQYTDGLRRSVLYELRKRRAPVVFVLDEAQHLYSWSKRWKRSEKSATSHASARELSWPGMSRSSRFSSRAAIRFSSSGAHGSSRKRSASWGRRGKRRAG